MKVLSLFDGMSCGQQALERAGIDVDTYYASEIDKYAIQVTMANYPNTIQLGSVVDINALELPKIDLVLGGSPCQSFSFAGKRKGMSTKDEQEILTLEHYLKLKSEGYEFEGQSYLFWEYMRILEELRVKNPNVLFLLENVEMGAKWEKVLSNAIGVRGIHINSALVSAQNRKRIYWINWGMKPMGLFGDMESIIEQPKDRGILLKDILESEVDEKYFLSEKFDNWLNKHSKKTGNEYKKTEGNRKAGCLSVSALKSVNLSADFILDNKQIIVHNTQRRDPNRPSIKKNKNAVGSGHLSRNDGKTYCLDTGNTNAVEIREVKQLSTNNKSNGGTQPYQQDRIYDINGISPALQAQLPNGSTMINTPRIRRLTPIECERLQTVTDNEISCIFELCLDQIKNYVDVVNQNPKLLKLVLSAENTELNELVKNVLLNMNANHQLIKHTAPQNVDMQILKETNQCTNPNQEEMFTIANNVGINAINPLHKEMDSAQQNVFINIIEGRIMHLGQEELLQKDKHFTTQLDGENQLKMCGSEIMQLVKNVDAETINQKDMSSTYTTLFRLNTKSLEKALVIYYLFAKNATTGYTQNTTQIKNLLLNFKLTDGYTAYVSDSQRYKMLGNGFTIEVISYLLKHI